MLSDEEFKELIDEVEEFVGETEEVFGKGSVKQMTTISFE